MKKKPGGPSYNEFCKLVGEPGPEPFKCWAYDAENYPTGEPVDLMPIEMVAIEGLLKRFPTGGAVYTRTDDGELTAVLMFGRPLHDLMDWYYETPDSEWIRLD